MEFHCADALRIQSSHIFCTLDPHGHARFNSIKRMYANPLHCWYLHCADVVGIQSSRMLVAPDPHGHAGFNNIKRSSANPRQRWYLHWRMPLANTVRSLAFPVVKTYNCLVGSARLSRVYARPARGSRVDRYTPSSIVEHCGLSPDSSNQKYK